MTKFNGIIIATENNGTPAWTSPDGEKHIWNITVQNLDSNQVLQCKTWEQVLAVAGYRGEIETYDKVDKRGINETWASPPRPQRQGGYQGKSNYVPRDDAAIKAMWAIGQAVATYQPTVAANGPSGMHIADIELYAIDLFNMVDRVKTGKAADQVPPAVTSAFGQAAESLGGEGNGPWNNNQNPQNNNLPL